MQFYINYKIVQTNIKMLIEEDKIFSRLIISFKWYVLQTSWKFYVYVHISMKKYLYVHTYVGICIWR